MPFVVGETIGPYRILAQLGRGGMATVFKAYHATLDRFVAIKALHPAFMEDPNFNARFQREARVVAKLDNPNIVPIYDFAEYERRPYLVMKYIEGETLKSRLTKGIFDQIELIKIVDAVGAGLSYAHHQGILHRDVKPSNVLLGYDNRVYLADFGLARIAQDGESTLSSDMMLGTPQYISPEQAMGLGELDERTDIYSFGVMLYEMMVGQVPFSADTPFSIIHDHIYTPLPLPRDVNPELSESVELVLLKALAKERDDRFPDVNALSEAFKNAVLAEPSKTSEDILSTSDTTFISVPYETDESPLSQEPGMDPGVVEIQETQQIDLEVASPIGEVENRDEANVTQTKKRQRLRWWYIPIGIVFIIACCFCSLVGYDAIIGFPNRDEPITAQIPEDIPLAQQDGSQQGDAETWVIEDSQDPYAWLNLMEEHSMTGQYEQAKGALNRALELAGDDADFYFNTAQDLANRGFWVEAAYIYLRGIQLFYPGGVPDELIDAFHESVYWATDYYEADREIPIPAIADVDIPLQRVAEARYQLYFGDFEVAQSIVEEVLTAIMPGMPEAILLSAEISFEMGDFDTSSSILDELMARDDVPDWIREHIEYLNQDVLVLYNDALAAVEANPDDPDAYLNLFEICLGLGFYDEADQAIQQALRLSGDNPRIALMAGELAANYGAWLYAARLFAHLGQINPDALTPELTEKIVQNLYYGALEEGAPDVFNQMEVLLPDDEQGILRGAYRDALIARYKLYYEDIGEAKSIIDDVVARAPKLALPRMVQAEIYMFMGDIPQSEAILLELQGSRTAPRWVHEEAQFLLDQIKP